jgi:voltage-dependent potassium channel beta subunit
MEYRRLGRTGLRLSLLSFGSWVTFGPQLDGDLAKECLTAAYEAGVNFFDNAEIYASGRSEEIMGRTIRELGWPRRSFVISTKIYMGLYDNVNMKNTLNRKYLFQAIEGSLARFGFDFVDLLFCHRPDPETPIEETVFAMNEIVASGKALYWGTSEWPADDIRAAYEIADRHHLHKPVMEQAEYNLLHRDRVEKEYTRLYDEIGLGLTTWSPLASGLLTGKYLHRVPEGSRGSLDGYEWLREWLIDKDRNAIVGRLKPIAEDVGCSIAQLAIAWCARNPHVSTVIMGASRVEQLKENLASLEVLKAMDDDVLARVNEAVGS